MRIQISSKTSTTLTTITSVLLLCSSAFSSGGTGSARSERTPLTSADTEVGPPHASSDFHHMNLSALYNADLFTSLENRTDGQVDSGRSSFPAEMMPQSETTFITSGIEFLFPSKEDGQPNAVRCEGQTLSAPSAKADYLYLLATAADGNQRENIILTHADGSEYVNPLDVNDWCAENPGLGGIHGLVSDYRHTLGGKQTCKTSIWMIPIRLRSEEPLKSVKLPENSSVFIISATIGPAGKERRLQTYIKDAFFPSKEAGLDRLVLLQVVEPEAGTTLRVLADDDWKADYRKIASFQLKGGVESIPVWLPVMKRRTYTFEIGGEHYSMLDETNLLFNAPRATVRLSATKPAHPADADLGMAPLWQVPALPDSDLTVDIYIPDAPADEMTLRAIVARKGATSEATITEKAFKTTCSRPISTTKVIDTGHLAPGDYSVSVALLLHDYPYATEEFLLTVAEPAQAEQPFGAREVDLGYDGPVWTNWSKSISYEEAWVGFDRKDIVINYPGQPYRYVFWKGASYAPIWLFDRNFITLEWLEAWPRQEGAVDCVEPLQDKTCQYSKAKLLSTTPARARVRWTYKETDFNLKVIHGEHAEEIYTMYPDGIGVRKVTGFFEKGRWHECVEFIVGSVAGTTPAEHYPPNAASLLNCDGERLDLYWPTPQESDLPKWNEYIGLAHSRNEPSVFLATGGYGTELHVFSNNPDWLSEMFFCMPHWPIQRGLPTTNEQSIEDCYNRATHASLLNFYAGPQELYKDHTVWALLLGIAPDDETELRDLVKGWLYPPELTSATEDTSFKYDLYQRAYIIDTKGKTDMSLDLVASKDHPQIRPALLVKGIRDVEGCTVTVNGVESGNSDFAVGLEDNGLVVWLNRSFYEPTSIQISVDVADPTVGGREKPGPSTSATAVGDEDSTEVGRSRPGSTTVEPST